MKRLPPMWLVVPVALVLLWGLVSAAAGLFCDGILLSFEQPVDVAEVHRTYVVLSFDGRSALALPVYSNKKLICTTCGMMLPDEKSYMMSGDIEIDWIIGLPLLIDECGVCRIEGQVSYLVPGLIWPLSYEWTSEWFVPIAGSAG